jgi:hypothetical protein
MNESGSEILQVMDADNPQPLYENITLPDRYLSVLISADTCNSKGVQCSPPVTSNSTQAGLSSLVDNVSGSGKTSFSKQSSLEPMLDIMTDSEDTDGDQTDSDEDYTPGPALAKSDNCGKVHFIFQLSKYVFVPNL